MCHFPLVAACLPCWGRSVEMDQALLCRYLGNPRCPVVCGQVLCKPVCPHIKHGWPPEEGLELSFCVVLVFPYFSPPLTSGDLQWSMETAFRASV